VTIKVTGNQWYWSYAYPKDQGGGFGFDSLMKAEDQIDPSKGDIRLLTVDNEAVVPVARRSASRSRRPTSSIPSPCRPSACASTPCPDA